MMRTYKVLCGSLLVLLLIGSFGSFEYNCAAEEELLSDDPRLSGATVALKKGEDLMKRAEREMTWNPGRSFDLFQKASDEFRKAGRLYKEMGIAHGIRVENEVQKCEYLEGRADTRTKKARKEKEKQKLR